MRERTPRLGRTTHVGPDRSPRSLVFPCLVVLLGAALRFYDLGAESYWYDEIRTLQIATGGMRRVASEFLRGDKPPLYLILMTLWVRVFGTTEVATRSLSAFAGIASVAAVFTIGRQLFGTKVGTLSATLMAISDFQIWYAQESRYYALYLLLTVLSFIFYNWSIERRTSRDLVLYVAATILMCYAYSSGVFVLAAQSLHFFTTYCRRTPRSRKEIRTPWVLAHTVVYLLVSPLIAAIFVGTRAGRFRVTHEMPNAEIGMLALTPLRYVAGEYPGLRAVGVALVVLSAGMAAFVLHVGKDTWLASIRRAPASVRRQSTRTNELGLLLFWLVCPILMQWALSKILVRLYIFRYTIGASPALYLLLSLGLVTLGSIVPEPLLLGTIAILAAPGLWAYYTEDTRENWRDAAAYVQLHVREGDPVIVPNPTLGRYAFGWYYGDPILECETPGRYDTQRAIVRAAEICARGSGRFWLILREAFVPGRDLAESAWRDAGLKLVRRRVFKGVLVYLFDEAAGEDDTLTLRRATCRRSRALPTTGCDLGSRVWPPSDRLPLLARRLDCAALGL